MLGIDEGLDEQRAKGPLPLVVVTHSTHQLPKRMARQVAYLHPVTGLALVS
jgi:hypothetical protein